MAAREEFDRWGRYMVAAALAGFVAWFAFVAGHEVPILDRFDLAIHEVGHLLFAPAPDMVMFIAGSCAQVLVPLTLAWYFGIHQRDAAGGGFCLAWAGASMWDVSVYIADAPTQALPLIGGGTHDWAYLLGPRGWNVMDLSGEIAGFVEFTGAVVAVVGIVFALTAAMKGLRSREGSRSASAGSVECPPVRQDPWVTASELPFRHEPARRD
jgi:hypothetical protein